MWRSRTDIKPNSALWGSSSVEGIPGPPVGTLGLSPWLEMHRGLWGKGSPKVAALFALFEKAQNSQDRGKEISLDGKDIIYDSGNQAPHCGLLQCMLNGGERFTL